ncbi:MFS transporter [Pseudonocardia spinosispora]|uniref:MFS transporter n=1 Tax=Pseudonocardia spinosispora TaxID=103441 RepID=UPI0004203685|nr:MFS transporter [Pseudonocardia spinosispora]
MTRRPTDTHPVPRAADTVRAHHTRTLVVLVIAQVFSGAGLAAGITVGALLAQDMLGATSLAGLPSAIFTVGSAAAAVCIARVSHRTGRRGGLASGYLIGAAGSAGVVAAAVLDNVTLLFVSLFVYGAGTATNLQARYAGADLAQPERRGRAVSTVLVATTLGALAGPNLITVMGDLARRWGIPPLAGPFILAAAAYGAAGLVLLALLCPDPLLLARQLADTITPTDPTPDVTDQEQQRPRVVLVAAIVMITAQLVMAAIMTMTPVHMQAHGHTLAAAGLVIAIHVGAMYLPSPLSGWLVDRYRPRAVAVASGLTLLLAGVLAMTAPAHSLPALAAALALLGLGWSFGLVSGTAMLASIPLATRVKTQGTIDLWIAIAGAIAGMVSGIVVAVSDYATLAMAGGLIAAALVPIVAVTAIKTTSR